jgi:hypothetical protein
LIPKLVLWVSSKFALSEVFYVPHRIQSRLCGTPRPREWYPYQRTSLELSWR